ncbi:MAG: sel1 repeat family protein [Gammaproteobacteria bacterium]|nr:sel1 repeat family protein [Gammaproteobacteria bacterium]
MSDIEAEIMMWNAQRDEDRENHRIDIRQMHDKAQQLQRNILQQQQSARANAPIPPQTKPKPQAKKKNQPTWDQAIKKMRQQAKHGDRGKEKVVAVWDAAHNNDLEAQKILVQLVLNNYFHVPGYQQKGIELLQSIAQSGDLDAYSQLGLVYEKSHPAASSLSDALYWYEQGAQLGCEKSAAIAPIIRQELIDVEHFAALNIAEMIEKSGEILARHLNKQMAKENNSAASSAEQDKAAIDPIELAQKDVQLRVEAREEAFCLAELAGLTQKEEQEEAERQQQQKQQSLTGQWQTQAGQTYVISGASPHYQYQVFSPEYGATPYEQGDITEYSDGFQMKGQHLDLGPRELVLQRPDLGQLVGTIQGNPIADILDSFGLGHIKNDVQAGLQQQSFILTRTQLA